jgi:hypothetical protein
MIRSITYAVLSITLLAGELAQAQLQNKISFGGAGRFQLDQGLLGGDLLDTDTTTARRELRGQALFDLGITIRPNENTEIKAITRVENDIDGFWGAGINFQLRELTARGVAGGVVRYAIGDIDAALTPYTLWNSAPEFRFGRTPAFEVFRDIVDYENFYADSAWRQQGLEAEWQLDFDRGIRAMTFHGLLSKNRQTDYFSLPDRLLAFGRIGVDVHPALQVQAQVISLFEVAESAQFNNAERAQRAGSVNLRTGATSGGLQWRLDAEGGLSSVRYANLAEAPDQNTEDFFVDAGASLYWPRQRLNWSLSYRDVGPDYRAPGAQSRRLDPGAEAFTFPFYTNRESQRPLTIADIVRDRSVYNRTLGPELTAFNPVWDNAEPYGRATPNRRGAETRLNWAGDSAGIVELSGRLSWLAEIRGEGTENKRQILTAGASGRLNLHRWVGWERQLRIDGGFRFQRTARDGEQGIDLIDLNSRQLEAGVQWEVYPRFDLLGGMLYLNAAGNEYTAVRDNFNRIAFYEAFNADLREIWYSAGVQYRFSESMVLSAQYMLLDHQTRLAPENAFTMRHVVVLYNMFF